MDELHALGASSGQNSSHNNKATDVGTKYEDIKIGTSCDHGDEASDDTGRSLPGHSTHPTRRSGTCQEVSPYAHSLSHRPEAPPGNTGPRAALGCSTTLEEQCQQLNDLMEDLPEIVYQSHTVVDPRASPPGGCSTSPQGRSAAAGDGTPFSALQAEMMPDQDRKAQKRKTACEIIAASPSATPSFKLPALAGTSSHLGRGVSVQQAFASHTSLMAAESEGVNPQYFSFGSGKSCNLQYANIPVQTQQMCSSLGGLPTTAAMARNLRSLDQYASDERHVLIQGNPSSCINSSQIEYQRSGMQPNNIPHPQASSSFKMPDAPQLKQVLLSLSTKAAQHLQQGTHVVSKRYGLRSVHDGQQHQDIRAPVSSGLNISTGETYPYSSFSAGSVGGVAQYELGTEEDPNRLEPGVRTRRSSGSGLSNKQLLGFDSKDTMVQDTLSSVGRSSQYRGVTRHRRSGRWEAHIWVKEIARQVYLGGYEQEDHAAEAYDVAAIKCKGHSVKTNFTKDRYKELLSFIDKITMEELVMSVRRQSQGFARGSSRYRGVTHHPSGRWEARIGVPGSKHIYLGLFNEEEEAGRAYDKALVLLRGGAAATNFSLSDYREQLAEYHQLQKDIISEAPLCIYVQMSGAALKQYPMPRAHLTQPVGKQDDGMIAQATAAAIRRGLDIKSNSNKSSGNLLATKTETRASASHHLEMADAADAQDTTTPAL